MKKMPPRKEPKEAVVYPASKRKGPAFKPQRPGKVPRVASADSESSWPGTNDALASRPPKALSVHDDDGKYNGHKGASSTSSKQRMAPIISSDSDDDDDDEEELSKDPLARPKKALLPQKAAPSKRKTSLKDARHATDAIAVASSPQTFPSQSDGLPQIPQTLLVRLLHEHFKDNATRIDKHAIVVFQKYVEVFVREAIARARLGKAEQEGIDADDSKWLDVEDLEKVAGHMMLEFG